MPTIKKYPNRKLYDMDSKQYITLDGIAELIRQDKEITVIDHATGQDITAVTLTQIILDQERNQDGFLPHTFLAGWIQANSDRWSSLQRNMSSSLGFLRVVTQLTLPGVDGLQFGLKCPLFSRVNFASGQAQPRFPNPSFRRLGDWKEVLHRDSAVTV